MLSQLDALQRPVPVGFCRLPGDLHSVAKQASFRIAFRNDFGGFGRPKSMFEAHFSMFFSNAFAHRCWVDILRLRTLKIELSPRREHDFRKIDVFKKGSKKHRFWLYFWKPNRRKSDKKTIRKMCLFWT